MYIAAFLKQWNTAGKNNIERVQTTSIEKWCIRADSKLFENHKENPQESIVFIYFQMWFFDKM